MNYIDITNTYISLSASSTQYNPSTGQYWYKENAVDNNLSTCWYSNGMSPQYLTFQFKFPQRVTKIKAQTGAVTAFKLQVSNNGTTWQDIQSYNVSSSNFIEYAINAPSAYLYYRFYTTASTNWPQVFELRLFVNQLQFLIQDNNQIKSSSDGKNITYVSNLPYTVDKFNNYSMLISNINSNVINILNSIYNISVLK